MTSPLPQTPHLKTVERVRKLLEDTFGGLALWPHCRDYQPTKAFPEGIDCYVVQTDMFCARNIDGSGGAALNPEYIIRIFRRYGIRSHFEPHLESKRAEYPHYGTLYIDARQMVNAFKPDGVGAEVEEALAACARQRDVIGHLGEPNIVHLGTVRAEAAPRKAI